MKIPTFCTLTSLVGLALASNPAFESTRVQQVLQEQSGYVHVPDLVAEGAVIDTHAALEAQDTPEVAATDVVEVEHE